MWGKGFEAKSQYVLCHKEAAKDEQEKKMRFGKVSGDRQSNEIYELFTTSIYNFLNRLPDYTYSKINYLRKINGNIYIIMF